MNDLSETQNRNKTKPPRSGNQRDIGSFISAASRRRNVLPPIEVSHSQTSKQDPFSARAIPQNEVQRHKQKEMKLQHMIEKEKQQAECIEALSKDKQVLDKKLSDIKLEMKEFVREGLCKETRDRRRLETLATRKYDNLEIIFKKEVSENAERYERLSTQIGNVERNHQKLENQISSNHKEIIGLLTQNRNDVGYIKKRSKIIHTQTSDDEDLNYDETRRRKKIRKS